jgi:hypothetical protein
MTATFFSASRRTSLGAPLASHSEMVKNEADTRCTFCQNKKKVFDIFFQLSAAFDRFQVRMPKKSINGFHNKSLSLKLK